MHAVYTVHAFFTVHAAALRLRVLAELPMKMVMKKKNMMKLRPSAPLSPRRRRTSLDIPR